MVTKVMQNSNSLNSNNILQEKYLFFIKKKFNTISLILPDQKLQFDFRV